MMPSDRLPPGLLQDEARVLRALMQTPPWTRARPDETSTTPEGSAEDRREPIDRGLRAEFRRATAEAPVPVEVLGAVWRAGAFSQLKQHTAAQREAAAERIACVLHLVALGADTGPVAKSFGAACAYRPRPGADTIITDGRFARLVNTPAPGRQAALARAFRRFRQVGIRVSPDDAEHLLRFLFTPDFARSVAHWAAGFYGSTSDEPTAEATVEAAPASA